MKSMMQYCQRVSYIWQKLLGESTALNLTRMLEINAQCSFMVKQIVAMLVTAELIQTVVQKQAIILAD